MNITALRGLWEKTTPGPWDAYEEGSIPSHPHGAIVVYTAYSDETPIVATGSKMWPLMMEDAAFIAAAHNEMGKLLDVVEAADRVVRTVLTTGASCMDDIRALNAALAKLEG